MMTVAIGLAIGIASCSKDDPEKPGGKDDNGGYGSLGNNLITIGSTRDVTYTSCVLLGTVDFPKITSDHTYGIVYMEGLNNPDFDYDGKLLYGGHSGKTDKEVYDCISISITNSSADGKFEKQLVNLKPATKYYYRAYVRIGSNVNYSNVEPFTTQDPMPEITMATGDPSDIYAVAGTMNGVINIGKLQDVNEKQVYGFIYATAPQLNGADKLTYEYYEEWSKNHFETEDEFDGPLEITTTTNMNGRISCDLSHLVPGTSYFYRTFFKWNGKYFYSPEVKTLQTKSDNAIAPGTDKATDVTHNSATLNASVPFASIGLEEVHAGFMISKTYSNASEFYMNDAVRWSDRYSYPDADIYYLDTYIDNKDYSIELKGLSAETTYYVRSFIDLGTYDGEKMWVYGSMQSFTTEKAPELQSRILEIWSDGKYPWKDLGDGIWMSGNKGIANSSSTLYVRVNCKAGEALYFSANVSSESSHDGLTIFANDYPLSDMLSGTISDGYIITFVQDRETVFAFTYSKDGSVNTGEDRAIVGFFEIGFDEQSDVTRRVIKAF